MLSYAFISSLLLACYISLSKISNQNIRQHGTCRAQTEVPVPADYIFKFMEARNVRGVRMDMYCIGTYTLGASPLNSFNFVVRTPI